jgi:hypothetical protein
MLSKLLGGLVSDEDKANAIKDVIQDALEDVAEQYKLSHEELFFMIKPVSAKFDFGIWIYKIESPKPTMLREISLKEILGSDEQ